jgi:hypothetical protein
LEEAGEAPRRKSNLGRDDPYQCPSREDDIRQEAGGLAGLAAMKASILERPVYMCKNRWESAKVAVFPMLEHYFLWVGGFGAWTSLMLRSLRLRQYGMTLTGAQSLQRRRGCAVCQESLNTQKLSFASTCSTSEAAKCY